MNALPELNDIVPAESAHWWPLPWGYWAIAIALLVLIVSVLYARHQHRQRNRISKAALVEISRSHASLSALNSVAKRAALQVWPQEEVAHLQGADWHRFLIKTMPKHKQEAFAASLQPFTARMYQPESSDNVQAYRALIHQWLQFGLPKVAPKRRPHV
ncbi:hypothetical protein CWE13_03780 [Aliidiomarina shirensis]|uniref:DUF4381 domain-containing protein n=1 Tax=Aliidiomarina shirensis TaxID=1048642 RepID=A0A432WYC6_9GAMM|nr:DUF4381 domain-containing protein [Aliidiomarina shirensis]RUO38765.1 hypothetical protein CWE13_03780 [Aliidiomarina shirensis]